MCEQEIKPCPYCGSTDIKLHDEITHAVWCQECFAEMPSIDIESAVELWNTRPIEDELRARIAELEAESDQLTARLCQERQDDKWIPVSERLPECEKDVLVFWGKASDGSKIDWFGTAWRNECDDGKWCTDPIVPTHWMPLPEPPIVYGKEREE